MALEELVDRERGRGRGRERERGKEREREHCTFYMWLLVRLIVSKLCAHTN